MTHLSASPGGWLARWKRWRQRRASGPARSAVNLDPGRLTLPLHYLTPLAYQPGPAEQAERARDDWFYTHHVIAARTVAQSLALPAGRPQRVLDLGCGDGIMALGLCEAAGAEVVGCDVTRAFEVLPDKARSVLARELPASLRFEQSTIGQPLPFADASFDAAYSWSVFEHVQTVPQLLAEVHRVLRPGAPFFLQIEPLYFSPFGSHLRRLLDEPWAHLLADDEHYLARINQATAYVSEQEKDMLYRQNEFEAVKQYLMGEYRTLNRIRSHELVEAVQAAGLRIERCELGQVGLPVPEALLQHHSAHDLRTNEIRLFLRRPAA